MTTAALPRLDVEAIRRDFPILSVPMHGRPLVYLDSAASSQKPRAVLDAERAFYETTNANIHRGVYALSAEATRRYDAARAAVAAYLDAAHSHEVIFTRGTTEGINLVAQSWARPRLRAGDEILITEMEHHSNIVPWQLVAEATGAVLKGAPGTDAGEGHEPPRAEPRRWGGSPTRRVRGRALARTAVCRLHQPVRRRVARRKRLFNLAIYYIGHGISRRHQYTRQ